MWEWLTYDPFIPFVTGVFLVAVLAALAYSSGEKKMIYLCGLVFLATVGIVVIEQLIVTDREVIEEEVYQLAFDVQQNDIESVIEAVDSSQSQTIQRIRQEMPRYDFETCRMMGITEFKRTGESPPAVEIEFTVTVQVRVDRMPELLTGQRRVRLFYEKNPDGKWRIVDYSHYNPNRGVGL